jgi:S-formylglutathione hydrolase FrmB
MTWSRTTIGHAAADLFSPPNAQQAILFLHPHGDETLAHPDANPAWTDALATAGIACCCPYAPRTWWCDRVYAPFHESITAENYLMTQVLPWMAMQLGISERAMAVIGISMGGQAALRLAFRYPDRIRVAVGIASAVDYHIRYGHADFPELEVIYRSREHCRQDTATLALPPAGRPGAVHLYCDPDDHDWFPSNDRLHEKLAAVGVPHVIDFTTRHGGHTWSYFNAMAHPTIRNVAAALATESRRLL